MSRGHICVLAMKTQCMRTKSSTAGSGRQRSREQREIRQERKEEQRDGRKLPVLHLLYCNVIINASPL